MEDIAKDQELIQTISLIVSNHGGTLKSIDIEKKWIDIDCPEKNKLNLAMDLRGALQDIFD